MLRFTECRSHQEKYSARRPGKYLRFWLLKLKGRVSFARRFIRAVVGSAGDDISDCPTLPVPTRSSRERRIYDIRDRRRGYHLSGTVKWAFPIPAPQCYLQLKA